METTREVLEKVRMYYEETPNGWIKGRYEDNEGGYCLDGAITQIVSNNNIRWPEWYPKYKECRRKLDIRWPEWYPKYKECRRKLESIINDSLVSWNDKPERTREEVMALLDRAINE